MRRSFPTLRVALSAACIAAAAAISAVPAAAGPTVEVRDPDGGSVFSSSIGSVNLQIRVDNANVSVAAGAFALQWRPVTTPGSTWVDFLTYCLEPDELLGISGTAAVTGELRTDLAGTDYATVATSLSRLYDTWYQDSLTSSVKSAAFQVALWEVAYENGGGTDLGAGKFQLPAAGGNTSQTGQVITQATSYLNMANWNPGGDVDIILRVGNQDLAVRVPEPATIALFGAGLLGLCFARRRRAA